MTTVTERTRASQPTPAEITAALADAERKLAEARDRAQRAQRDAAREYLRSGEVTSVTAEISALEDVVAGLRQLAIIANFEALDAEYRAARRELEAASEANRSRPDPDAARRVYLAEGLVESIVQRMSTYQLAPLNAAVLADHRREKNHE